MFPLWGSRGFNYAQVMLVRAPRWLSGKRVQLPMQEAQEVLLQSLGGEEPLE